nr:hypothetical protein [Geobacillus thermoleovorans]
MTGVQAQTVSESVEDYVSLHHTLPDVITELPKPHEFNAEDDLSAS